MGDYQAYLQENRQRFVDELVEFLRIPSISSLPEHKGDVERAGEWVADRLRRAGLEHVEVLPTAGRPVVYGDWLHAPDKPTILIYGHFDTQPVDPIDLWTHPPFEPAIEDGRVYARGASDDKGNMLVPILAIEALLKSEGELPVNVKFFLEGEEEIGSPDIPVLIQANRERLSCNLAVSADGGQWSEEQPLLLLSAKGLVGLQIDLRGAKTDLHSGLYGGAVQNPIHALVQLLASMRSAEGKILVEGFYDAVVPLSEADRARIAAVPFDEAAYKERLGVDDLFGEAGYTTMERSWARPTLEINGIGGGFQGEGVKTVLPREAFAKITCRLVADQDPEQIFELIKSHVENHTPAGVTATVQARPGKARPYLIPAEHPGNRAAHTVLREIYGREPYYTRIGGSVPALDLFMHNLGAYTVTFGFGLEDERWHAPDEFYRLSSFERGQTAYCRLLHELSQTELGAEG